MIQKRQKQFRVGRRKNPTCMWEFSPTWFQTLHECESYIARQGLKADGSNDSIAVFREAEIVKICDVRLLQDTHNRNLLETTTASSSIEIPNNISNSGEDEDSDLFMSRSVDSGEVPVVTGQSPPQHIIHKIHPGHLI